MAIWKCSIIGLGKLGACMAAAIASKGFKVIGVDKKPELVRAFNRKQAPAVEPMLDKMLKQYRHNISATTNCQKAVLDSDLTFIVVPTPSQADGGYALSYVKEVGENIAKALSKKSSYHLVVLTSTVLPAATQSCLKPILEKQSGKKCDRDFGLCYNPEFIALGTVIRDFLNPDFVLIGQSDKKAGSILKKFYSRICDNNPPLVCMNLVNAELTKIAVNSFITTKITFANMLAALAERIPEADADIVTQALGLDSRIGKRYLRGGLGYGGPCFPRDNAALGSLAKKLKIQAEIPQATDRFNRRIVKRLFNLIDSEIKLGARVGILGLSYKPGSNVIEQSQGFLLTKELLRTGRRVILYDPLAMAELKRALANKAIYAKGIKEVINRSDLLVIANADPAFRKIKLSNFPKQKNPITVIDGWRLLRKQLSNSPRVKYIPLGLGS